MRVSARAALQNFRSRAERLDDQQPGRPALGVEILEQRRQARSDPVEPLRTWVIGTREIAGGACDPRLERRQEAVLTIAEDLIERAS